MTYRKKLIEVALPLNAINDASAYDKMPGIGPHPKNLHWWWARLPLPAARVFLFASVVDDPDQVGVPEPLLAEIDLLPIPRAIRADAPTLSTGELRRHKIHGFVERLAKASHAGGDEDAFAKARKLVDLACEGQKPLAIDPFSGGGSIPLEASRLGFDVLANDLNPVAALISAAQLDLPAPFVNQPPVRPHGNDKISAELSWEGHAGLAEDVRCYGQSVLNKVKAKIGSLFPDVVLSDGSRAVPLTYLWCRTVESPNPAVRGAHVPLIRSFALNTKSKGKDSAQRIARLVTHIEEDGQSFTFCVKNGPDALDGPVTGTVGRKGGKCLLTGVPIPLKYIREQGVSKRLGVRLMTVVADSRRGKQYFAPTADQEEAAFTETDSWRCDLEITHWPGCTNSVVYGSTRIGDLFTKRQSVVLTAFSDAIRREAEVVKSDAIAAGLSAEDASARSKVVAVYLSFALSRLVDFNCMHSRWKASGEQHMQLFARQAIPMSWDFAETNPFATKGISWSNMIELVAAALEKTPPQLVGHSRVQQGDATRVRGERPLLLSTDPPYYSSVPYAALSDFFYVLLRRTLGDLIPERLTTLLAPKAEELVADPERRGGAAKAAEFFELGFRSMFSNFIDQVDRRFPTTIYYAFKQQEGDEEDDDDGGESLNAGWETILQALIDGGFEVTGTLPVRAAQNWRMRAKDSNAVASYIVLVCRGRESTKTATRREFHSSLRGELQDALRHLQTANIAPVDLSQAVLGPGISIFSRYAAVLESNGQPMRVRAALTLINEVLSEVIEGQQGAYDEGTRFAITWFQGNGFDQGEYGSALTLANRYNVPVESMERDGFLSARGGKVRLLKREELPADYDPAKDRRATVWEATQYLVRSLDTNGEIGAAQMMRRFRETHGEIDLDRARELAYRLWRIADGKRLAQEARVYNALVLSWSDIEAVSQTEDANWDTVPEARNLFTE